MRRLHQPCGAYPTLEIYVSQLFVHNCCKLGFRQRLFEQDVLLLQLGLKVGLLSLHEELELPPAVVGQLSNLKSRTHVLDGFTLGQHLLSSFEIADDRSGVWRVCFMIESRPTLAG